MPFKFQVAAGVEQQDRVLETVHDACDLEDRREDYSNLAVVMGRPNFMADLGPPFLLLKSIAI